jgi:ubiquinone biosynthesis protein
MTMEVAVADRSGRGHEGLRGWLRAADAATREIEDTAWALRGLADRSAALAQDLCEAAGSGGREIARGWEAFSRDAARWRDRLARVRATGASLLAVAASYRLHGARSAFRSRAAAAAALEALHERNAKRFTATSCEQGGAFLKVGQMLSARPDLLPAAWIRETARLQDAAPAVAFEEILPILEEDLGGPLGAFFASFDREPLAAASIGQVHRATTRVGAEVAVKVQRPDIGELMDLDLDLLELFLEVLRSMLPPTDYDTIVTEVRAMLRGELDYPAEARMMNRISAFFADHPRILAPRALPELTGARVFASTFVPGRKITVALDDWRRRADAGDAEAEARLSETMGLLLEAYVRQVLVAGVFQADPHPGNLLVTDDGRLAVLDFGSSREIAPERRAAYLALLQAFLAGDRAAVGSRLGELGFATRSGSPDTLHVFAEALLDAFQRAARGGASFEWPGPEELARQARRLLEVSQADPVVRIPAEFVLLGRVFLTLGGLFQYYRPRIDYARTLAPVLGAAA